MNTNNFENLAASCELPFDKSEVLRDMILNEKAYEVAHNTLQNAMEQLRCTDETLYFDVEDGGDLHTESIYVLKDYLRRTSDPILHGYWLGLISFRIQLEQMTGRSFDYQ